MIQVIYEWYEMLVIKNIVVKAYNITIITIWID